MLMIQYVGKQVAVLIKSLDKTLFRWPDNFRPRLDENGSKWRFEGNHYYGNARFDVKTDYPFEA